MKKSPAQQLLSDLILDGFRVKVTIVFLGFLAALVGIASPLFQKLFIDTISLKNPTFSPFWWLGASTLCLGSALFISIRANLLAAREAFRLQGILAQKIYNKTIQLRPDALKSLTVGEMVSSYGVDAPGSTFLIEQNLPQSAAILFPLILAPLVLIYFFDLPASIILGGLFIVTIVNFALAYRQSLFFSRFKSLAAERTGLVSEWIQNMRTLRILGWIDYFESKIFKVRVIETQNRIEMVTNGQFMNAWSSSINYVLNFVLILWALKYRGTPVTSGEILSLLWIVGVFLTRPFRQLPWFFTFVFDSWTSIKRLAFFFETENSRSPFRTYNARERPLLDLSQPAISVKNLNLVINKKITILKDINFSIKPQKLTCIVGSVGSGKSMLLNSLLGENGASFGSYTIFGSNALNWSHEQIRTFIGFVPQDGFIFSSSLRDNVNFQFDSSSQNDSRVLHSLKSSEINFQKDRFPLELETPIGERGLNLSGGQKQRVGIARAHLQNREIILIDDSFSAIDRQTEETLTAKLLFGEWAYKTRLFVTHRLSLLPKADDILFLSKGEVLAQGNFFELMKTSSEFKEFVHSLEREQVELNSEPIL